MDFITYQLSAFSNLIEKMNLSVRFETITMHEDPINAPENSYVDTDGILKSDRTTYCFLINGYEDWKFHQIIKKTVLELRSEIESNLDLPIANDKKMEFVQATIEKLKKIEGLIYNKGKQWYHKNTIISNELSSLGRNRAESSSMLYELKISLRDLLSILNNSIKGYEPQVDGHLIGPTKITSPLKITDHSFSLFKSNLRYPNLHLVCAELKRNNFISQATRTVDFKKVFSGESVNNPVVWIGRPGQLRYFILQLEKQYIIIKLSEKWKTTCLCFIKANNQAFKNTDISQAKIPKQESITKKLKDAITLFDY